MPKRGENIYKRKDGRWEGRYINPPVRGSQNGGMSMPRPTKKWRKSCKPLINISLNPPKSHLTSRLNCRRNPLAPLRLSGFPLHSRKSNGQAIPRHRRHSRRKWLGSGRGRSRSIYFLPPRIVDGILVFLLKNTKPLQTNEPGEVSKFSQEIITPSFGSFFFRWDDSSDNITL